MDFYAATPAMALFLKRCERNGRLGGLFADAQAQTAQTARAVEYLVRQVRRQFPALPFSELPFNTASGRVQPFFFTKRDIARIHGRK